LGYLFFIGRMFSEDLIEILKTSDNYDSIYWDNVFKLVDENISNQDIEKIENEFLNESKNRNKITLDLIFRYDTNYFKKLNIKNLYNMMELFCENDFETYVAKVEIVKNAEFYKDKIAISMSEATHTDMPIIVAQAADELLSISGIQASFVLCKVEGIVMISGRSMGDINVQTILEKIGGGGHLTFAGAQIAGVSLEQAKEKLIESIDEYYK